ncbi:MAG: hypothetical protein ABIF77_06610 [bacterium]
MSSASGSSTRILSLGGAGDYFADSHHVTRWFGCLPDYTNLAILELGQHSSLANKAADQGSLHRQGVGVHYALDAEQRWGSVAVYLSEVTAAGQVPGSFFALWARSFGAVQMGCYGNWSFHEELSLADEPDLETSQLAEDLSLGLGLRSDLADRLYGDFAVVLHGSRREFGVGTDILASESGWRSFDTRVRFFAGFGEHAALVPLCEYTRVDRLAAGGDLALAVDRDHYETRIGLGLNLFPDADNLLIASYEVQFGREDRTGVAGVVDGFREQEIRYNTHQLRIGIESRVLPWLSLRGGGRQRIPHQDITTVSETIAGTANDTVSSRTPELDLNLGLGIFFCSFTADLVFSDTTPFTFGHFLTGAGADRDSNFSSITLSYRF